jgi:ubiquinone/menaquinone biosynthesis C-methylase UbiE
LEDPFRKDLKHLSWDEVYARQEKRAHLVDAWMNALALKPGDRVLDVGAGPGYISLVLAARVGRDGLVYALDRSADALAHLERLQGERGVPQIRRIVADAAAPGSLEFTVDAVLVTMMLHHAEDPVAVLRNLMQVLPPQGLAVIGEFHPEAGLDQGPPPEHRIAPEQVRAWCQSAGLAVLNERRQSPDHYMLLVRRP